MTEISTSELRKAANLLINHLEDMGIYNVKINEDFYWEVPKESRYDQYNQPVQLSIGQLSDDLNEINRLVSGNSPIVSYALVWLANVLRRVGEISPP
jgi:hypothetical protein